MVPFFLLTTLYYPKCIKLIQITLKRLRTGGACDSSI